MKINELKILDNEGVAYITVLYVTLHNHSITKEKYETNNTYPDYDPHI